MNVVTGNGYSRILGVLFACVVLLCGPGCSAQSRWERRESASGSDAANTRRELRIQARQGAARPWLGVKAGDAANESGVKGALVDWVAAGSPAEKAGILKDDIITHVGDTAVTDAAALVRTAASLRAGLEYRFTVVRSGKPLVLLVRPELRSEGGGRFADDASGGEITDEPAPRKGPLDINVLRYAFIDPKTRVVTFVGTYDPAYNTGPIPYEDYLVVAVQHPYPSFSLEPPTETLEALRQAAGVIDADMKRLQDVEYANQWAQKAANLLINDPSLAADNKRFFKHCARELGVTGDELKRMHDAATGKIEMPPTEFMGLAAKMIRGIGLVQAGDALGVLAAGGTPEEMLSQMADKLGLSSQYNELAMRGLSPEQFRKEEIILCISEICRHFEAPENEIQSHITAIRSGESADLIIDYMGRKLSDFITNKSGRRMINGLVLGPGVMAKLYGLPVPKAELVFDDLPSDSLLGDVFFKSDYRLKSICTFPDARDSVPAHLTQHELMQREATAAVNRKLCSVDVRAGNRLVPGEVAMRVSPSGDVVEFGVSRIKVLGWIIEMQGSADTETSDFVSASLSKYADRLTQYYDDYARAYPEWHKLSEAAKIIALARWAANNGYVLKTARESGAKVNQPRLVDGFWSAVFEAGETGQYLTFIAEGGASFGRDEGESWLRAQQDVTVTSDAAKQLAASAIFAEQALGAAVSGGLESARELAEKSAQAMTGEIDLNRLPSLEGVPTPSEPASYAAATAAAIEEAAQCLDRISSAAKEMERAQQIAAASPEEAEKVRQQAAKAQDEARERLNQILEQVRNYRSDPSRASEALVVLRSGSAAVTPIGGSVPPPSGSAGGADSSNDGWSTPAASAEDWKVLVGQLDDVNRQIAAAREALVKLNASIQADRKLFEEWEKSASEGLDRCVSMIADVALDFGISGIAERQDTLYKLAQKLPGKPEDVIEKYRFTASLAQRLKEAKAVSDVAGLAERENKTEAELWETFRDGVSQLSGLFSLDDTIPGKWWKYGILAVDTAYNLTDLRLSWKNVKALESNNERYAEAVRKLSDRLKDLVERQKEIRKKIDAGGMPEKISN